MQWTVEVPEEMDRTLREFLRGKGDSEQAMAEFVRSAVQAELFRQLLKQTQSKNSDLYDASAQELAVEAVAWARAHRS